MVGELPSVSLRLFSPSFSFSRSDAGASSVVFSPASLSPVFRLTLLFASSPPPFVFLSLTRRRSPALTNSSSYSLRQPDYISCMSLPDFSRSLPPSLPLSLHYLSFYPVYILPSSSSSSSHYGDTRPAQRPTRSVTVFCLQLKLRVQLYHRCSGRK